MDVPSWLWTGSTLALARTLFTVFLSTDVGLVRRVVSTLLSFVLDMLGWCCMFVASVKLVVCEIKSLFVTTLPEPFFSLDSSVWLLELCVDPGLLSRFVVTAPFNQAGGSLRTHASLRSCISCLVTEALSPQELTASKRILKFQICFLSLSSPNIWGNNKMRSSP